MTARAAPRKAGRVGRPCKVCRLPEAQRAAIDEALVAGESDAKVAAKVREISDDAVRRHREAHLPASMVKAAADQADKAGARTLRLLDQCLERVLKVSDACDRWLSDPDQPDRYEIGPRSDDVLVTYEADDGDGGTVRRKARLSELLARVEGIAPRVAFKETKHADPRTLILQTSKRMEGALELLARIQGQLKDPAVLNLSVHVEWIQLRGVILRALDPYPDARLSVARALEAHGAGR